MLSSTNETDDVEFWTLDDLGTVKRPQKPGVSGGVTRGEGHPAEKNLKLVSNHQPQGLKDTNSSGGVCALKRKVPSPDPPLSSSSDPSGPGSPRVDHRGEEKQAGLRLHRSSS